jgi:hypothetical protein
MSSFIDPNDPGPIGDPAYSELYTSGNPLAGQPGLPPFPTWPPPSGGAPVTAPELGPILNPFPYGSPQGANISLANPAPAKLATKYPMGMPPKNGQNQSLPTGWPTWPHNKVTTLPDKAPPSISQIP